MEENEFSENLKHNKKISNKKKYYQDHSEYDLISIVENLSFRVRTHDSQNSRNRQGEMTVKEIWRNSIDSNIKSVIRI